MSKRKEDWVHIIQPDNKNKIASPGYINKLLGVNKIEADVWNLKNLASMLERKIIRLERPHRQEQVVKLLSNEENPHNLTWLQNRIQYLSYLDLSPLVENLTLLKKKSGSITMYYLKSSITHEVRSQVKIQ